MPRRRRSSADYEEELWANLAAALPPAEDESEELSGPPLTFREFIQQVNPRYRFYRHCEELIGVLQRVADGELHRVMVFMPPRHSKSETVSRLFTAYYLYRHPDRFVGLASYGADLAYTMSRAARDNFTLADGRLSAAAKAVKHWVTAKGGGFWAAGVGGPATGKGFHLGVIDDPIKDAQEASSAAIRRRNKDWYDSVFATREEPGGSIVVLQTRWHDEDPSGYLLSLEADEPEHWYIVNMPAIAEAPPAFPATCTVHPDWRQPGEPLCPERYSLERLKKLAKRIGEYFFGALFQQRPRPREGGLFKSGKIAFVDAVPQVARWVRRWDLAATDGDGDYTVGALWGLTVDGQPIVADIVRGQWGPDERNRIIRETAELDRQQWGRVQQIVPQDPGSAGVDAAKALIKLLTGFIVSAERESGDKVLRAEPLAAQWNAGNVLMLRAAWNKAFLDELTAFPTGSYDDQVDGSSGAFNALHRTEPAHAATVDFYADGTPAAAAAPARSDSEIDQLLGSV